MSVSKSGSNWAVFGQAAWEQVIDLEKGHDVHVSIDLYASARRGVFIWEIRAVRIVENKPAQVICRVQAEFPNSRAETLEAFLYSLTVKLAHCVEARAADEAVRRVIAGS